MNDIIKDIIQWVEDNGMIPDIHFYSECGGIYLILKLSKRGKSLQHRFYIPGGVLCVSNWDMKINETELNYFISKAKEELQ